MNIHAVKGSANDTLLEYLRRYFTYTDWEWTWHNDHPDYGRPHGHKTCMGKSEVQYYVHGASRWDSAGQPAGSVSGYLY